MNRQNINYAAAFIALLSGAISACAFETERPPTRGRIPASALLSDGTLDMTQVPDFIVAYARDGSIAGYVSIHDVLSPEILPGEDTTCDVLDETLQHVVGHMVPNRGFVPGGVDPEKIPLFELAPLPESFDAPRIPSSDDATNVPSSL